MEVVREWREWWRWWRKGRGRDGGGRGRERGWKWYRCLTNQYTFTLTPYSQLATRKPQRKEALVVAMVRST